VKVMFLTHRDDVADHQEWADHFRAERVMHRDDVTRSTANVERQLTGPDAIQIAGDLIVIPTPGHTRGHACLLYRDKYLFSGDHLWWSPIYQSLNASASVCWYSWAEQTRSVERLLDYTFEWVLPGHGHRAYASSREMREQLRACVERMKARGVLAAS
jgi:glyoxylase-like metal-dependent hydrolase (beta-lactamase superfamily II)